MNQNQNLDQIETSFSLDTLDEANNRNKPQSVPKGLSHFRILPPFGTNHGRALFHEYTLHWGFLGSNGSPVPVSCSWPTEGYCPACKVVFGKRDELKRAEAAGDEELKEELQKYISTHGAKRSFIYNVVSLSGQAMMLSIPKTAHDGLKKKIIEAVGNFRFDPTSLDHGAWFQFEKTGALFSTKYVVDFRYVDSNEGGRISRSIDMTPIAPELVSRIREQLASGGSGALKDIHVLHAPKTAKEIQAYMSGFPVTRPSETAPEVVQAQSVAAKVVGSDAPASVSPQAQLVAGVSAPIEIRGSATPDDIQRQIAAMRQRQQQASSVN